MNRLFDPDDAAVEIRWRYVSGERPEDPNLVFEIVSKPPSDPNAWDITALCNHGPKIPFGDYCLRFAMNSGFQFVTVPDGLKEDGRAKLHQAFEFILLEITIELGRMMIACPTLEEITEGAREIVDCAFSTFVGFNPNDDSNPPSGPVDMWGVRPGFIRVDSTASDDFCLHASRSRLGAMHTLHEVLGHLLKYMPGDPDIVIGNVAVVVEREGAIVNVHIGFVDPTFIFADFLNARVTDALRDEVTRVETEEMKRTIDRLYPCVLDHKRRIEHFAAMYGHTPATEYPKGAPTPT